MTEQPLWVDVPQELRADRLGVCVVADALEFGRRLLGPCHHCEVAIAREDGTFRQCEGSTSHDGTRCPAHREVGD